MAGFIKRRAELYSKEVKEYSERPPLLAACQLAITALELGRDIKTHADDLNIWSDRRRGEIKSDLIAGIDMLVDLSHSLNEYLNTVIEHGEGSSIVDDILSTANEFPAMIHDSTSRSHVHAVYIMSKYVSDCIRPHIVRVERLVASKNSGSNRWETVQELDDEEHGRALNHLTKLDWMTHRVRIQIEKEYERAMKLLGSKLAVFPGHHWTGISKRRGDWVRCFKGIFSERTFSRYIKDQIIRNRKTGSMIELHPDEIKKYLPELSPEK